MEKFQPNQDITVGQLQPNMNGFNATVIVLEPGQNRRTQTGTILTMKVADQTGSINATIMNPEFTETFRGGDILKIRGGYTSVFQGGLTLGIGRNSECKKCGEFNLPFSELPDITSQPLPPGTSTERRSFNAGDDQSNRPGISRNPIAKPRTPPNF